MAPRELDLAVATCCTRYVVSIGHPVPACHRCGLTPQFECSTLWYLGLDDD